MPTLSPITVSADTYIVDSSPTTNFSTLSGVNIYTVSGKFTATNRGILQFDLTTIPSGVTITNAVLSIYGSAVGTPANIVVAQLTQSVVVSQATWNQYSTGNSWTTGGGDWTATNATAFTTSFGNIEVDISAMVQATKNASNNTLNILLFQPVTPPGNAWHIASLEDGVDPAATLTVSYIDPSKFGGGLPTLLRQYRKRHGRR